MKLIQIQRDRLSSSLDEVYLSKNNVCSHIDKKYSDCTAIAQGFVLLAATFGSLGLLKSFPYHVTHEIVHDDNEYMSHGISTFLTIPFLFAVFVWAYKTIRNNKIAEIAKRDSRNIHPEDPFPAKELPYFIELLPVKLYKKLSHKQIRSIAKRRPDLLETFIDKKLLNDKQLKIWFTIKVLSKTKSPKIFLEFFTDQFQVEVLNNPLILEWVLQHMQQEILDDSKCMKLLHLTFLGIFQFDLNDIFNEIPTEKVVFELLLEVVQGSEINHIIQKVVNWVPLDICFTVQGKEVKANKNQLAESSLYMNEMLANSSPRLYKVDIEGVEYKPFKDLVDYCMYGLFEPKYLTFQRIDQLEKLAAKFKVNKLVDLCLDYKNSI